MNAKEFLAYLNTRRDYDPDYDDEPTTRRKRLAFYVQTNDDYEFFPLIPKTKDTRGEERRMVVLVKTTMPETIVSDSWEIIVDDIKGGYRSRKSDEARHCFERVSISKYKLEVIAAAIGYEKIEEKQEKQQKHPGGRPRRELTDDERARIIQLRAEGMTINAIATEMKISNRRVSEVLKGIGKKPAD